MCGGRGTSRVPTPPSVAVVRRAMRAFCSPHSRGLARIAVETRSLRDSTAFFPSDLGLWSPRSCDLAREHAGLTAVLALAAVLRLSSALAYRPALMCSTTREPTPTSRCAQTPCQDLLHAPRWLMGMLALLILIGGARPPPIRWPDSWCRWLRCSSAAASSDSATWHRDSATCRRRPLKNQTAG